MAAAASSASAPPTQVATPRLGQLTKAATFKRQGKLWVVAYDGSRLATRALRLAAALYVPGVDKIRVISVESPSNTDIDRVLTSATADIRAVCKVAPGSIVGPQKVHPASGGETIATTIKREVDAVPNSILVIGRAGRGAEDAGAKAARAKGEAPISKMAEECLKQCVSPVLLVNGKAYDCLGSDDAMRQRAIAPQSQPCKIVCCVDGHIIAQTIWDNAVRIARKGDAVDALHIIDSDMMSAGQQGSAAVVNTFKMSAQKAMDIMPGATMTALSRPKLSSIKATITKYIDEESTLGGKEHPADLLMMASVQLGEKHNPLGSLVAAMAKGTAANIFVVKHFA